jgi:hypothetical protein
MLFLDASKFLKPVAKHRAIRNAIQKGNAKLQQEKSAAKFLIRLASK